MLNGSYHAKLPLKQREDTHVAFVHDRLPVVVATVAFGMGIDKVSLALPALDLALPALDHCALRLDSSP